MPALNKKIVLCFLMLFWVGIAFSQESEPKDFQQTLENYPPWLAEKGDCYRAQSETLRYVFTATQNRVSPHPSLVACQFNLGDYKEAVNVAEDFLSLGNKQANKNSNNTGRLLTFSYLKLGKDQKAKESWARYVDLKGEDSILLDSEIQGRISVENARIYSAILPGAGFLVSQSYGKAALAFLLNGIFIAGTYQAYQNHQFGVASLLLFFEIGWYKGGINAAEEAAENYNRRIVKSYRERWIEARLEDTYR